MFLEVSGGGNWPFAPLVAGLVQTINKRNWFDSTNSQYAAGCPDGLGHENSSDLKANRHLISVKRFLTVGARTHWRCDTGTHCVSAIFIYFCVKGVAGSDHHTNWAQLFNSVFYRRHTRHWKLTCSSTPCTLIRASDILSCAMEKSRRTMMITVKKRRKNAPTISKGSCNRSRRLKVYVSWKQRC